MYDYSYLEKAKWGWGCFVEDYLLLIGIVANLKPRTILEIGTHSGLGAVVLAHAATQWHRAQVVTIDVNQQLGKSNLHLVPGIERHIEFVEGNSNDILLAMQEQERRFDLVFMDGAHDYVQVKQDWSNSQNLTTTWILHDTTQFTGLQRLVQEIRIGEGYDVFQFISAPGYRKRRTRSIQQEHFRTGMTLVQKLSNLELLTDQAHRDDDGRLLPGHED